LPAHFSSGRPLAPAYRLKGKLTCDRFERQVLERLLRDTNLMECGLFRFCGYGNVRSTALFSHRERLSRQNAMEERRKYPRTDINEPAYVSAGGSVMSCVVRNISVEGAAIDVENPAFVPPRFRLAMANGSAVYECSVSWIQNNRMGLTFTAAPPPEA
jgi:hypothetical protein